MSAGCILTCAVGKLQRPQSLVALPSHSLPAMLGPATRALSTLLLSSSSSFLLLVFKTVFTKSKLLSNQWSPCLSTLSSSAIPQYYPFLCTFSIHPVWASYQAILTSFSEHQDSRAFDSLRVDRERLGGYGRVPIFYPTMTSGNPRGCLHSMHAVGSPSCPYLRC